MITVYFECRGYAEKVAIFQSEELYHVCLPALQAQAKKDRMIVTESYDEDEELT